MIADQHARLTADHWASFSFDRQVLMIANEMHRAGKLLGPEDGARLKNCYVRVLRLADLTAAGPIGRGSRRELLRWRDLIAALYLAARPSPAQHRAAFRCLLRFTPAASAQLPLLVAEEVTAGG